MPGSFVHLELNTDDTDRAKEFYQQLFGWKYQDWPMGDSMYYGLVTPEPPGGGIQTNPMPHAPSQWVPYVSVEDIHDTVARARSAGAEIVVDFMKVGESGELAILRDPSGATLGLWKQTAAAAAAASSGGKKKGAKKGGAKKGAAKKGAAKKGGAKKGGAKKGAAKKGAAKKGATKKKAGKKKAGKK
jgi:uncharacterized protein